MTDRDTVTKLLSGNHRELHRIYRQASTQLKPYLLHHTATPEDVDELTQDIFLHFLDALPLFHYQSNLMTFTKSIAQHEVADYWRKKYAKRLIRTIPIVKNLIAPIQTPEHTAQHVHHALQSTYQKLRPQEVTLLKMKYEDALSVKDIATKLRLSPKAVECGLYRARKAFQLSYKEYQS